VTNQNIVAEYRLFCIALLQKRPIILKSLLIVATPYHRVVNLMFCCYECMCMHVYIRVRIYTERDRDMLIPITMYIRLCMYTKRETHV